MNKLKIVYNIITTLLMILAAVVIMLEGEYGYLIVLVILAVSLLVFAIRQIIYYFSLARHMVGGKIIFIEGVILLDLALFTFSVNTIPQQYVMIYMLLYFGFSGVVDILRAFEEKKMKAPRWSLKLIQGIIVILVAVAGMIFSKSQDVVSLIFGIGLIYSAVLRMVNVFRKEALPVVR